MRSGEGILKERAHRCLVFGEQLLDHPRSISVLRSRLSLICCMAVRDPSEGDLPMMPHHIFVPATVVHAPDIHNIHYITLNYIACIHASMHAYMHYMHYMHYIHYIHNIHIHTIALHYITLHTYIPTYIHMAPPQSIQNFNSNITSNK